jgi:leucyl/phenylalanyl-tRNA--protein transferase
MSQIREDGTQIPIPEHDLVRVSPLDEPLSPFMLLFFQTRGAFPWLQKDQHTLWWCPQPRAIIVPSELRVSRSLRRTMRRGRYRVTADVAFEEVVERCAAMRESTWITEDLKRVWTDLHLLGHAHSIEVWRRDDLVGGLFGTVVGKAFSGCSMFHSAPDASKVALVRLTEKLAAWGFPFIDCQMGNAHLRRMGARLIPRDTFLQATVQVSRATKFVGPWTPWFDQ